VGLVKHAAESAAFAASSSYCQLVSSSPCSDMILSPRFDHQSEKRATRQQIRVPEVVDVTDHHEMAAL
jgi:hypothetical protein